MQRSLVRLFILRRVASVLVLFLPLCAGHAQVVWLGGTGNWYGPWLGNTLGGAIPPSATTNWGTGFQFPNFTDAVVIGLVGTNYGYSIGAVNGTAILNTPASVTNILLGQGASGELDVAGTTLNAMGIQVGESGGSGTLSVSAGGVVNVSPGSLAIGHGTVMVSGLLTASEDIVVNGTLSISAGGVVNGHDVVIGLGASGTVTVSGSGSQLNVGGGSSIVGISGGQGTLSILNGGVVTIVGDFGVNSGSSIMVSGSGSQLNAPFDGLGGTLTIQNGAQVTSPANVVVGAPGMVTLTGAGSEWNTGLLLIDGSIDVSGGAQFVTSTSSFSTSLIGGGQGSIALSGPGTSWFAGNLEIGYGGAGKLTVEDGAVADLGSITIDPMGAIIVDGSGSQLSGLNLSMLGDLTLSDGAIGNIFGNYQLVGLVTLDIAGPDAFGQLGFDPAQVGSIGGTIDIDFIDGFKPSPNESFVLIKGGNFASPIVEVSGLPPGTGYTFSNGTLTIGPVVTPEPSSFALLGGSMALIGLAAAGRRLRRRAL